MVYSEKNIVISKNMDNTQKHQHPQRHSNILKLNPSTLTCLNIFCSIRGIHFKMLSNIVFFVFYFLQWYSCDDAQFCIPLKSSIITNLTVDVPQGGSREPYQKAILFVVWNVLMEIKRKKRLKKKKRKTGMMLSVQILFTPNQGFPNTSAGTLISNLSFGKKWGNNQMSMHFCVLLLKGNNGAVHFHWSFD